VVLVWLYKILLHGSFAGSIGEMEPEDNVYVFRLGLCDWAK